MLEGGLRAVLTCVDTQQCPSRFVGSEFDHALLSALPQTVDPCGERGEFHTFAYAGPMFERPVRVRRGERRDQGRFSFMDLIPDTSDPSP